MRIDPITFEIIRHKLYGVVDEAIIALKNVSGSPITNEGHDLMVSLYRADGGLLIGGVGFLHHITSASQACKHIIANFTQKTGIFEDDVFMLNDPYTAALHTPDVYLIAPIHHGGRLVSWVANFVHVTDIGAIDAGGFSPRATESFHEGFSTQGLKLMERGELQTDKYETFLRMVREPSMVALDLKSQIAACNVAKQRMHDLIEKYGIEAVDATNAELIDQSESLLRRRLSGLPDGRWRAREYLDMPYGVSTINLTMTKRGDKLEFDFAGTSDQVQIGVNCTYWATWGATFAPVFPLLCHDMTWNDGVTRPVQVAAPEGSLVNCRRPATTSLATVTSIKLINDLSTLLISKMYLRSPSDRKEATAVWHGSHAHTMLHGTNQFGEYFIAASTDSFAGSGGARTFADGVDVGGEIANLISRWANVETHELNTPLMFLFRKIARCSPGPGRYRGGAAHEYAITPYDNLANDVAVTTFGKGVIAPQSYGLSGGYPGCNVDYLILRGLGMVDHGQFEAMLRGGYAAEKAQLGVYNLKKADVFYVRFPGGGGYGDPLERDPHASVRDYWDGVICNDCVQGVYGVVLDPSKLAVDEKATGERRRVLLEERRRSDAAGAHGKIPNRSTSNRVPINEYLSVTTEGDGQFVTCRCGFSLCLASSPWKNHSAVRDSPPSAAGHKRFEGTKPFFLREFMCPACYTVLEVEVLHEGDKPLNDELFL